MDIISEWRSLWTKYHFLSLPWGMGIKNALQHSIVLHYEPIHIICRVPVKAAVADHFLESFNINVILKLWSVVITYEDGGFPRDRLKCTAPWSLIIGASFCRSEMVSSLHLVRTRSSMWPRLWLVHAHVVADWDYGIYPSTSLYLDWGVPYMDDEVPYD